MSAWAQRILNNFASLQAAPVAAVLLLVAGAGAGSLGGYRVCAGSRGPRAQRKASAARASAPTQQPRSGPADVASISSIVRQPNSEIVDVSYNQVVPQQIEGSLDDPGNSPVADAGH